MVSKNHQMKTPTVTEYTWTKKNCQKFCKYLHIADFFIGVMLFLVSAQLLIIGKHGFLACFPALAHRLFPAQAWTLCFLYYSELSPLLSV